MFAIEVAQVSNEADEEARIVDDCFTDEEFDGECRAISVLAGDDAPDTNDVPLARLEVMRDEVFMVLAKVRWHQDFDVLAQGLCLGVTEQLFGGRIEGVNFATDIDGDDRLRRGVDHGVKQSCALGRAGDHLICGPLHESGIVHCEFARRRADRLRSPSTLYKFHFGALIQINSCGKLAVGTAAPP